ncbi:Uncharacterized protein APZ42_003787 [Daphnia magna]|uniref:Uncharacterized protein n=1 Tax=Daphnia magna TaxID=35525 RepID=A0A162C1Z2_9CRUS|nr:Uncharacterized protein APZ42_003787 [Daphnia magna]
MSRALGATLLIGQIKAGDIKQRNASSADNSTGLSISCYGKKWWERIKLCTLCGIVYRARQTDYFIESKTKRKLKNRHRPSEWMDSRTILTAAQI